MKNIFGSIFFMLGLLIIVNGCQQPDNILDEIPKESLIRNISLNEFVTKTKKNSTLNHLSRYFDTNKKNLNLYNFNRLDSSQVSSILTDEIMMIQREDKVFYTFRISTINTDNNFYNLLVVTDNENVIESVKILEYIPSQTWLEDPTLPFSGHLSSRENDIFLDETLNNLLLSRGTEECIIGTRGTWECNYLEGHAPGEGTVCTEWYYTISVIYGQCPPELGIGDDSDNGVPVDTSDGGGGGDSGNSDPDGDDCQPSLDNPCPDDETIILTPKSNDKTVHEKNCEELNKLTSPPVYNSPNPFLDDNNTTSNPLGLNTSPRLAIINSDNGLLNDVETGYSLYNAGNFQKYGPYAHYESADGETHEIEFGNRVFQFGAIHTHPSSNTLKQWIPMFSLDDIYSVLRFRNLYSSLPLLNDINTNGDALFTNILIVELDDEVHTYAIKIDDISKFQQLEAIYNDQGDLNGDGIDEYKELNDELRDTYIEDANNISGTATQYQKALLNFISNNDLGISLYQMEQLNEGTPQVTESWKRINLGLDGNLAESTPCD